MCIRDSFRGADWPFCAIGTARSGLVPSEFWPGWRATPVSYTHLDVYKRQIQRHCRHIAAAISCEPPICLSGSHPLSSLHAIKPHRLLELSSVVSSCPCAATTENNIRGVNVLDRKTPPPLPTASPISSVVPPPLPKTIAIPAHPPLPIEKSEPVQVAVPDDERVELVTSDELFALPPLPASSPTQSVPALVCPAPEVPPQALPIQPIVDARAQPSKKKILWGVAGVAGLALIVCLLYTSRCV